MATVWMVIALLAIGAVIGAIIYSKFMDKPETIIHSSGTVINEPDKYVEKADTVIEEQSIGKVKQQGGQNNVQKGIFGFLKSDPEKKAARKAKREARREKRKSENKT